MKSRPQTASAVRWVEGVVVVVEVEGEEVVEGEGEEVVWVVRGEVVVVVEVEVEVEVEVWVVRDEVVWVVAAAPLTPPPPFLDAGAGAGADER